MCCAAHAIAQLAGEQEARLERFKKKLVLPYRNLSLTIPVLFSKHLLKAVPIPEKTSFETHGMPPLFPEVEPLFSGEKNCCVSFNSTQRLPSITKTNKVKKPLADLMG
jgi:hypothetical protein